MSYIIIEDERPAYNELQRMMTQLRPDYELAGWAQTTEQATLLLRRQPALAIADIRLADGLSFEAFEAAGADVPVIFTTAYDDYAIKAFKLNSVDYLLKPIVSEELETALSKYERGQALRAATADFNALAQTIGRGVRKSRFLVRSGDGFVHVSAANIAYFYSEDKVVILQTFNAHGAHRYVIDRTLDALEDCLDSAEFFRISRGFIVNVRAIVRTSHYFGGRLALTLNPAHGEHVTVSRARANAFLRWLGDEN